MRAIHLSFSIIWSLPRHDALNWAAHKICINSHCIPSIRTPTLPHRWLSIKTVSKQWRNSKKKEKQNVTRLWQNLAYDCKFATAQIDLIKLQIVPLDLFYIRSKYLSYVTKLLLKIFMQLPKLMFRQVLRTNLVRKYDIGKINLYQIRYKTMPTSSP